jgi:hypothetical protein
MSRSTGRLPRKMATPPEAACRTASCLTGTAPRRLCRSRSPANLPHAVNSRERAELLRQQTEQADRNNRLLSTQQRGVLDIPGALGTEQTGATATLWEKLLTTAAPKALAGDSISQGNLQQKASADGLSMSDFT